MIRTILGTDAPLDVADLLEWITVGLRPPLPVGQQVVMPGKHSPGSGFPDRMQVLPSLYRPVWDARNRNGPAGSGGWGGAGILPRAAVFHPPVAEPGRSHEGPTQRPDLAHLVSHSFTPCGHHCHVSQLFPGRAQHTASHSCSVVALAAGTCVSPPHRPTVSLNWQTTSDGSTTSAGVSASSFGRRAVIETS